MNKNTNNALVMSKVILLFSSKKCVIQSLQEDRSNSRSKFGFSISQDKRRHNLQVIYSRKQFERLHQEVCWCLIPKPILKSRPIPGM